MKSLLIKVALLFSGLLTVLVIGCTPDKAYHPINPSEPLASTVTLQVENHGWSVYPTEHTSDIYRPVRFDRFWVEYSDKGEPHDLAQMEAVFNQIENIKTDANTKIYLAVFVHGWNQNADDSDGADEHGISSSDAVRFNYFLARQAEQLRRLHEQRNIPEVPHVIGVYIGWRGNTTNIPLLSRTTLGNRAVVADRIANNRSDGSLYRFLQDLSMQMPETNEQSRMLIIGHSLGGRLVSQLMADDLQKGNTHPFGEHALILALEPAVGADCYDQFSVSMTENSSDNLPPSLWLITSKNDRALAELYPIAASVKNIHACRENSDGYKTPIGLFSGYTTHELYFEHLEEIKNERSDTAVNQYPDAGFLEESGTPWALKDEPTQYLAYYLRDLECSNELTSTCYDTSDAGLYAMTFNTLPTRINSDLIWNIVTDRNTINFGNEAADSMNATHNGYVSTNLSRLVIEWLYR